MGLVSYAYNSIALLAEKRKHFFSGTLQKNGYMLYMWRNPAAAVLQQREVCSMKVLLVVVDGMRPDALASIPAAQAFIH